MSRYQSLAQQLQRALDAGHWPSGLPSERQLSQRLAVSRHTARQALGLLCQRGMLERRRGSGTYPAASVPGPVPAAGRRQWLLREAGPGSAEELLALGLSPYQWVARLHELRTDAAGAGPTLEIHSLALSLLPQPQRFDGSLDALLTRQGLGPVRRLQRLRATNATPQQARLLGVGPGTALLHITRQSYAAQGQALLLSHSYRLGEVAGLRLELRR